MLVVKAREPKLNGILQSNQYEISEMTSFDNIDGQKLISMLSLHHLYDTTMRLLIKQNYKMHYNNTVSTQRLLYINMIRIKIKQ